MERSDSGGDPGLGPGNQVTEGHKHGVRKHVRLGVQGESAWPPRYIRNSIIAIIACYYYTVVMIIRNSIIAIIACYCCDNGHIRNSIIAIIACYYYMVVM